MTTIKTSSLLRDVVREYVRSQRRSAGCGDAASTAECHLLTELLRAEPVTQQQLADRLMLDKGWISRGIDRLLEAGMVTRAQDPHDKRRVQLRLSTGGRKRAAALDESLDAHAGSLLAGLTPDEERQLAPLLAHVLTNLRGGDGGEPDDGAPQSLRCRRAQAGDWPAIERLLRGAHLPAGDAAAHLAHFTVATAGAGIAGVGGFEVCGQDVLLRSFVLAARFRSRGNGSTLLTHVLADARAQGASTAWLLTQTADGFFARHGFRRIDRDAAPQAIRTTREFTALCPASAILMMRDLSTQEDFHARS